MRELVNPVKVPEPSEIRGSRLAPVAPVAPFINRSGALPREAILGTQRYFALPGEAVLGTQRLCAFTDASKML